MKSSPTTGIKFTPRETARNSKTDNQVNLKPLNALKEQIIAGAGPPDNALDLPIPNKFDLSVTNASDNIQEQAERYATVFEKKLEAQENIKTDEKPKIVKQYEHFTIEKGTEFPPVAMTNYNTKKSFEGHQKFVSKPNVVSAGNNFINRDEGSTMTDFLGFSDLMDIKSPKDIRIKDKSYDCIRITKDSLDYSKLTYLNGHKKQCKDPVEEKRLIGSYMDDQPNLDIKYMGKNVKFGYHGWLKENINNTARKS